MSYVQVTTEDDRLLATVFKMLEIITERLVPLQTVVESAEFVLRVWSIDIDEHELGELGRDDAALGIVLVDTHVHENLLGFLPGEDDGSRIALLLGGIPIVLEGAQFEWKLHLLWPGLCFLQAENIGIFGDECLCGSLFECGADPVDVPGN